jgi:hypothetical protein
MNSVKEKRRNTEIHREKKWLEMVKDSRWKYDTYFKKSVRGLVLSPFFRNVRNRIRKGIPDAWRGRIWIDLLQPHFKAVILEHPYNPEADITVQTSEDIEKDIERTFPRHELFIHGGSGQDLLRNILRVRLSCTSS